MALETGACKFCFVRRYLERNPQLPLSLRQVDPLIRMCPRSLAVASMASPNGVRLNSREQLMDLEYKDSNHQ